MTAFPAFLFGPLAVFLHPALLAAGAAAAAVPIVIHLLNRRRVRPQPWAAMTWLLAALKKHQRRLKMENWLILALRTAALLLLGLALSRWILSDSAFAALTRPKRSVVLLLDTSYSTGAKAGARAVSDRVREEADKVLSALGSDDKIAVVVSNDVRPDRSGARPAVLAGRGVGREGASRAKLALGAVRPTEAPAPWADALAACSPRTLLQDQDLNRVLVWVTDLQAADWRAPASRDAADPLRQAVEALRREGVELEIVDVGGTGTGALPNLCVASVAPADATDVFVGHGFQLRVGVVNYGPRLVEGASLRVFLDDAPAPVRTFRVGPLRPADATTLSTHEVTIPVDVPRDLAFTSAGSHVVRAEIAPPEGDPAADSLGLDSRRFLALDVRARLRVAAWIEPGARSRYDPVDVLRGLFVGEGAGDVFEFEAARSEDEVRRLLADPARAPGVLILGNRVPRGPDLQREIGAFVSGGGALMVFSGDDFDEVTWNAAFHATPATRLLPFRFGPRERRERREEPWTIDFSIAGVHPMSQAFVTGDAKFVRTVPLRLFGRTRLLPPDPTTPPPGPTPSPAAGEADAEIVLRFAAPGGETGLPALVEGAHGLGRVLYMGTSLDDDWNPAAFALFLPVLLNDAALDMTRSVTTGRNLRIGGTLRATLPRDATNPRLSIPGRGEEVPSVRAATTEDERPEVLYDRVGTSGAWRLAYERPPVRGTSSAAGPRRVEEVFGVDPDPAEGLLLRADHVAVSGRIPGSPLKVVSAWQDAATTREAARQGEMTSWVLLLVALILLIEPYLAMRFGRHGAPAGDVGAPIPAATAPPPPVG